MCPVVVPHDSLQKGAVTSPPQAPLEHAAAITAIARCSLDAAIPKSPAPDVSPIPPPPRPPCPKYGRVPKSIRDIRPQYLRQGVSHGHQ